MAGLKAADLVGRTVLEVLPATEKHWIEAFGKVAISGDPVFFAGHYAAIGKDFEVKAFCPSVGRFASVFADITERTQAENALRRNWSKTWAKHSALPRSAAGIWTWRRNQVVWTEELYKMYGFDPALPVPPYTEHMKLFTTGELGQAVVGAGAHPGDGANPTRSNWRPSGKAASKGMVVGAGRGRSGFGKRQSGWPVGRGAGHHRAQAGGGRHPPVLEARDTGRSLKRSPIPLCCTNTISGPTGHHHIPYTSAGITRNLRCPDRAGARCRPCSSWWAKANPGEVYQQVVARAECVCPDVNDVAKRDSQTVRATGSEHPGCKDEQ
jgi:hypothetical protein